MAAPEYVPQPAVEQVRSYSSPPRRPASWRADRPGDSATGFPRGERLGSPGPDQGYIYLLARRLRGRLRYGPGEHEADVIAGGGAVALKRASLLGRAPMVHDLTVAFTIWGYLGDAPDDLVEVRRRMFAEVSHAHHYEGLRALVDTVPAESLRKTPEQVAEAHRKDWRSLLDLP